MNHKNPVSGTGDGVPNLDIMKKYANCPDCRFWQVMSPRHPNILALLITTKYYFPLFS